MSSVALDGPGDVQDRVGWVHFARWQDVGTLVERHVRLDSKSRAISLVYAAQKPQSYEGSTIIHPAIGAILGCDKGKDRPSIPEPVLRIRATSSAALEVKAG
eukprot:11324620-Alexandrium_andersonii.AAC.1